MALFQVLCSAFSSSSPCRPWCHLPCTNDHSVSKLDTHRPSAGSSPTTSVNSLATAHLALPHTWDLFTTSSMKIKASASPTDSSPSSPWTKLPSSHPGHFNNLLVASPHPYWTSAAITGSFRRGIGSVTALQEFFSDTAPGAQTKGS